MIKNSNIRRRSSSQPGRLSQDDRSSLRTDPRKIRGKESLSNRDSLIPKPRFRSSSTDRLSIRKTQLRVTGGPKTSITAISPMVKSVRPSITSKASISENKGHITPKNSRTGDRNVRASSAERANNFAPKGPKKDCRPLNDKAYQSEMLAKVDSYFHSIGQISILNNNGSIKPLSLKIFVEATNLMVKLLDMKINLTLANYIEEIPKVAKKLHYPGAINKSWLKTANTIHSWSHAVGWLCWLVELCEAKDIASENFSLDRLPIIGESEEEKEKRRNTFSTMIKCYEAWNEENSEKEQDIMKQFLDEEAERRGISQENYDKVKNELEKVKKILEEEQEKLDKENAIILEEEEALSNLKKDLMQQNKHNEDQEQYIEKVKKETEQLNEESIKLNEDILKLIEMNKELSATIEQQPMSITERDEILQVCSEQKNYIQNFETHLEEIRKESYSLDIKLTNSNKNLVKIILEYNRALFKYFSDSNINVNELLMPEDGQCEADFLNRIEEKKTLMREFLEKQKSLLVEKSSLLQCHNKELEALQTKKNALSREAEKKRESEEKYQQNLKQLESKKREEVKVLENEINTINNDIQKLSTESEQLKEKLIESEKEKEALIKRKQYVEQNSERILTKLYSKFDENRSKITSILKKNIQRKK